MWQRYRIEAKAPGGAWSTFWDEMASSAAQAVRLIRAGCGARHAKAGYRFRAVAEAGELFGTGKNSV